MNKKVIKKTYLPGNLLLKIAKLMPSKVGRVLEDNVLDMRIKYLEAIDNDPTKAKTILYQYYKATIRSLGISFFTLKNSARNQQVCKIEKSPSRILIKAAPSGQPAETQSARIEKPPGWILIKVADFLPPQLRRNLIQEVSDMRLEYYEALCEKNIRRGRFIVVFYHIGLGLSVVSWISYRLKEVVGIIPKRG